MRTHLRTVSSASETSNTKTSSTSSDSVLSFQNVAETSGSSQSRKTHHTEAVQHIPLPKPAGCAGQAGQGSVVHKTDRAHLSVQSSSASKADRAVRKQAVQSSSVPRADRAARQTVQSSSTPGVDRAVREKSVQSSSVPRADRAARQTVQSSSAPRADRAVRDQSLSDYKSDRAGHNQSVQSSSPYSRADRAAQIPPVQSSSLSRRADRAVQDQSGQSSSHYSSTDRADQADKVGHRSHRHSNHSPSANIGGTGRVDRADLLPASHNTVRDRPDQQAPVTIVDIVLANREHTPSESDSGSHKRKKHSKKSKKHKRSRRDSSSEPSTVPDTAAGLINPGDTTEPVLHLSSAEELEQILPIQGPEETDSGFTVPVESQLITDTMGDQLGNGEQGEHFDVDEQLQGGADGSDGHESADHEDVHQGNRVPQDSGDIDDGGDIEDTGKGSKPRPRSPHHQDRKGRSRSRSPRSRSRSRRRTPLPRERTRSPRGRSRSPRERHYTPREYPRSPRRRSRSPRWHYRSRRSPPRGYSRSPSPDRYSRHRYDEYYARTRSPRGQDRDYRPFSPLNERDRKEEAFWRIPGAMDMMMSLFRQQNGLPPGPDSPRRRAPTATATSATATAKPAAVTATSAAAATTSQAQPLVTEPGSRPDSVEIDIHAPTTTELTDSENEEEMIADKPSNPQTVPSAGDPKLLDFLDTTSLLGDAKSQVGDDVDDNTWDDKAQTEFKTVLQGIHRTLPSLKIRYDQTPKLLTCAEMECDNLNTLKPITAFPESIMIPSAFQRIHTVLLGSDKVVDLKAPEDVPPKAKSSNNFTTKRIPQYKKKNYSATTDRFLPEAPPPGPPLDRYTSVDYKSATVPLSTVLDIETQCRKALLAVSATDILTGCIRRLNAQEVLSDQDQETRDLMCRSLIRASSHAGIFLANATATSMMARRKAYLDLCPANKVPSEAKEWLMLQPFVPQEGAASTLFGNVQTQLQEFAERRRKLNTIPLPISLVKQASLPYRQSGQSRSAKRSGSHPRARKPTQSASTQKFASERSAGKIPLVQQPRAPGGRSQGFKPRGGSHSGRGRGSKPAPRP